MKKKSVAMIMALAASLAVSGCSALSVGGSDSSSSTSTTAAAAAETEAAAEAADSGSDTAEAASSTDFPTKTIEVIVPFAAGGGADVATRLICSYLEQELGQTMVINNVTGGGGTIGLTQLTNASPDGYTIAYFASTNSNDDSLFEGITYNKDSFAPIAQFTADPHMIVASKKSGITDVQGLIDAGADGSVLWGIGGAWTNWDFLKMSFEDATGTSYKRLVFDGGATAVNNVASGDCAIATPFISEALAQVDAGNIIPIAVTGSERNSMAPDVPTLAESGIAELDGFESVMWRCFVAPAGTPDEVIQVLSDAVGRVCENEEFIQKAEEAGLTINYMGGDDFKNYYEENHVKVKEMIDNANFED
ncbi:MAG: tripartite tricarboxylate transporter substrate binding protein [Clostridiales bacterium]|nr:tripartite tricarboxylate transporter substrate binding protein [Clostridiales bacterium]